MAAYTTIDLTRIAPDPGDGKRLELELEPAPVTLGDDTYALEPATVPVRIEVSRTATGYAMRLVLVAGHGPVARNIGPDDRRRRVAWCGGRRAWWGLLGQGSRPDECRHHDDECPACRDPLEPRHLGLLR